MKTRTDFFVGFGESTVWLGSIVWEEDPEETPQEVRRASSEEAFRQEVAKFVAGQAGGLTPERVGPSYSDDVEVACSYIFDKGEVHIIHFTAELEGNVIIW